MSLNSNPSLEALKESECLLFESEKNVYFKRNAKRINKERLISFIAIAILSTFITTISFLLIFLLPKPIQKLSISILKKESLPFLKTLQILIPIFLGISTFAITFTPCIFIINLRKNKKDKDIKDRENIFQDIIKSVEEKENFTIENLDEVFDRISNFDNVTYNNNRKLYDIIYGKLLEKNIIKNLDRENPRQTTMTEEAGIEDAPFVLSDRYYDLQDGINNEQLKNALLIALYEIRSSKFLDFYDIIFNENINRMSHLEIIELLEDLKDENYKNIKRKIDPEFDYIDYNIVPALVDIYCTKLNKDTLEQNLEDLLTAIQYQKDESFDFDEKNLGISRVICLALEHKIQSPTASESPPDREGKKAYEVLSAFNTKYEEFSN